MREKLDIAPGERENLDECEGSCSSIPTLFSPTHRDEIHSIISLIPSLVESPRLLEVKIERFRSLLDLYQEQPTLLNNSINAMISQLLSFVRLLDGEQSRLDTSACIACGFLAHIAKVRGYKAFLSFLPHEVFYLEKVLYSLEKYADAVISDVQYILLLWMAILCKNPFDLSRFDATSPGTDRTIARIIDVATPYLHPNVNKFQVAAALLLSITLTRKDASCVSLPSIVANCLQVLQSSTRERSNEAALFGELLLLASIFKRGKRDEMIDLAEPVLETMNSITSLSDSNLLVKKLSIKVIQRLGLIFLKPKSASWKYERGNRVLTTCLSSANDEEKSDPGMSRSFSAQLDAESDANEESNVDQIEKQKLEIVLSWILKALSDRDTDVRWNAAKGIGRIVSKLPRSLGNDVVASIITNNFNIYAGMADRHGGCLAIAELLRRGYVMIEHIADVVNVVREALVFDEPQGRHSHGANVRDAACYICWALPRAFRSTDLVQYVNEIASLLASVALFDREINIRRAASAAFQENAGRLVSFSHRIEILTKMDYYAVGVRQRAFLEISVEVAKYSLYAKPLIQHLINHKIGHWDEEIRFLAAEALQRLCKFSPSTISDAIDERILVSIKSMSLIERQGAILALAATLSGLSSFGYLLKDHWLNEASLISRDAMKYFDGQCRMHGASLMQRSMNTFIDFLSSVLPFDIIPIDEWFAILECSICEESNAVKLGAINAASSFFQNLLSSHSNYLIDRVTEVYLPQILHAKTERQREGFSRLLSKLPIEILSHKKPSGVVMTAEIVNCLISTINSRTGISASWVQARRASILAITEIVKIIHLRLLENHSHLMEGVIRALDDYSLDARGDIGRLVRESAMCALEVILPIMQRFPENGVYIDLAICKIVQQSCEKIDAIRECAARVINEFLRINLPYMVEKETLVKVYSNSSNCCLVGDRKDVDWRKPACFERLALLITSRHYSYYALCGFVASAGGLSESTKIAAADALLSTLTCISNSIESLENFLDLMRKVLVRNLGNCRVLLGLLSTLELIFADQLLSVLGSDPDSSPSLCEIMEFLIKETAMKTSHQKMKICTAILCHTLHFNRNSMLWKKSARARMACIDVTEILHGSSKLPSKKKRRGNDVTLSELDLDVQNSFSTGGLETQYVCDESTIRRLVQSLSKRVFQNRVMRLKHADDPTKFMESEIEVNVCVQELHKLATKPELYGIAVELELHTVLLQLLAHENSDIIACTIDLLQELIDVGDSDDKDNIIVGDFIVALIDGQLIETLVQQSVERLDESIRDEADAIHHAISIIETVLDFNPQYADKCVEQGFFTWCLRRCTQKSSLDANKMYASEMLAVLLQTSEFARHRFTEKVDGFDLLLRALAAYKRHDPASPDEREHMENLFNAVCSALMYPINRQKFLDGEGLQLMNLMLRERKESRESALKVLDHAMSGVEGKDNCAKFVEILGLRTLFPLFMRTPARTQRKDATPIEHEEHVCSILASLFRSCNEDYRARLFVKFAEHEYEKVDRAVELIIQYRERLKRFDTHRARVELLTEESESSYLDRLDTGLYTLQLVVLVLADVCVNGQSGCRSRAMKLFQLRTGSEKLSRHLIPVLEEYEEYLGPDADDERKRTRLLIARLSNLEKGR